MIQNNNNGNLKYIMKNLANKQRKQITIKGRQQPQKKQQYEERECSKLANYLNTISELESKIKNIERDNATWQSLEGWVQQFLKSHHKSVQVGGLRSLLSASSKINILERQAILGKKQKRKQQKTAQLNKQQTNCSSSLHLRQILKPVGQIAGKVKNISEIRRQLYEKINNILARDEPYMQEKIMLKISRQVQKQKKVQTLKYLQSLCKQKQQAVAKHTKSIVHKIDMKTIEQKVANNLNKMKQIMMKKLSNEEFKYEIVCNQQFIDKNVKKFDKCINQMKSFLDSKIIAIKQNEENIEEKLRQIDRKKHILQSNIQLDLAFIDNFQKIVSESERALSLPLKTENSAQYLNECEMLERQINQISRLQFKSGK